MKKPIQFGKYYLLDRINVGGMAEVFKAKAFGVEGFERLLAVKRILPNIAEDEEFITMFIDEAKIAVQLNHANVCQIFDLGKVEDSYFIALEFVHGKDLRAIFDRCKQKPVDGSTAMPIAQASFIVMKACEGLDYAHNKRDGQGRPMELVHRDVSPQNVLISYEGEVKLIDFGIAKAAGKMSKTQQGILKGKFGYMSPEQVRGLPLDRRSDIFSLGIVLYELLTGERLFVGESDFSTLEKVRNVEILPPSTYNRRISDELERIVMKALAKDVDDRYQNAIDLHDDLQAYMYSAGEFYSRKDLAGWMKKSWAQEIEAENVKLEAYQKIQAPPPAAGTAAAAGGTAQPERPRRNSVPPPPPGTSQPQRISGQMSAVPPGAAGAAGAPPPVPQNTVPGKSNGAHKPPHVGAEAELAWDDEELATNIYDNPDEAQDASGQVVDDKPDLSKLDLNPNGAPVPMSGRPSREMPAVQPARNGSSGKKHDFALPEASGGFTDAGGSVSRPDARRISKAPLYTAVGVVGAVTCAALVWLFVFLGNKPGEVVITSDPAANVQVLVDNKRVPIDGTPATLKLEPGSYVLTVQREGYVPWNEQVEVKAGERVAKRIVLEPLAAAGTGFTLVSDPPGLKALLDGTALPGVTPFKVGAVTPGKHHLEIQGPNGASWTQDVELESGKIAELHAQVVAKPEPLKPEAPKQAVKPDAPPKTDVAAAKPDAPKVAGRPDAPKPEPKAKAELPRPPKEEPKAASRGTSSPAAQGGSAVAKKDPKPTLPDEDLDEKPAPAPKVGKTVPETKSAGGDGYLRLGSKPWTNIAVDGKETGLHTPQTQLKLSAGSHRITLANPQFNIKETFSVDIRPGETSTVIEDLRPQGADSD